MKDLFNKPGFMMATAFLEKVLTKLSPNLANSIRNGDVKVMDAELYVRKQIVAGDEVSLLKDVSVATTGITNFDGVQLGSLRYFVISALTLNYGEAADGTAPQNVDYSMALPAAVKNADLVIRQDGRTVVEFPVSSINDAKNTDARYRILESFELLKEGRTVEIKLKFGADAAIEPATVGEKSFVELLLRGYETRQR